MFEEESQKHPLFGALRDKQNYVFTYVNTGTSKRQELDDEDVRLCDVCPFLALLRLIERKGDKAAIELDAQIGLLIGKSITKYPENKYCIQFINSFVINIRLKRLRFA